MIKVSVFSCMQSGFLNVALDKVGTIEFAGNQRGQGIYIWKEHQKHVAPTSHDFPFVRTGDASNLCTGLR